MKDIPEFEQLYAATQDGQIWSHYKNKFLKPITNKAGYLKVTLVKNKTKYSKLIHRLIAQTYLPNPNNYPIVNHKDENKANNNINNLQWCNYTYNSNYGSNPVKAKQRMQQYIKQHPNFNKGKNNPKSIQIKCAETDKTFESFSAAAKWCHLSSTTSFTDYFKGEQSYVGLHPQTNEKLHWIKIIDGQEIYPIPYQSIQRENNYLKKSVLCIETNEIFKSIKEAQNFYNIRHIGECCSGRRKTAGGKHWQFI